MKTSLKISVRSGLVVTVAVSGLTGLCGSALAQASGAAALKPSLSSIDPPRPGPGFRPQPPLHRASGTELRAQVIGQLQKKFAAADTSHTGAITADQASQGGLKFVARNFSRIDTAGRGAVTFDDIQRYLQR